MQLLGEDLDAAPPSISLLAKLGGGQCPHTGYLPAPRCLKLTPLFAGTSASSMALLSGAPTQRSVLLVALLVTQLAASAPSTALLFGYGGKGRHEPTQYLHTNMRVAPLLS